MSIRWVSSLVFAAIFLTALGLGLLSQMTAQAGTRLHEASEGRHVSNLLAEELRASSDELTRLARTFVVTGNEEYERQYWDVLAVRNGEKPRPDGRRVPLQTLMREAGFTEEEFALLAESQANSDGLVTTETVAMNAIKGLYDDGNGHYVVRRAPDPEMASRIMHDSAYHADKARIMDPIDRFENRLNARTGARVQIARQEAKRVHLVLQCLVGLLIVLAPIGAWATHRHIVQPAILLEQQIGRVSLGDHRLDDRVRRAGSGSGEMAQLARSVAVMVNHSTHMAHMARRLAEGDLSIRVEPRSDKDDLSVSFQQLADRLRHDLTRFRHESESLGRAASHLSSISSQVAAGVAGVGERASAVASAAEETSATMADVSQSTQGTSERITSVATSTEEMTATIGEIAHSAESTRQVTATAVESVSSASGRVTALGEAADRIGKVLAVIVDIADQTKLLALNATIEAASAGDAGKGFAVVANEVKELARQTADATADIRTSVEAIQATSQSTVDDIGHIQVVIAQVDENVASIAAAVEEQAVTTRDIAVNVGHAAQSMEDISDRIGDVTVASTSIANDIGAVDGATRDLNEGMDQVEAHAKELAALGSDLQKVVEFYKVGDDPQSGAAT